MSLIEKGGVNLKKISKLFTNQLAIEYNPFERDHSPVFNPERSLVTPELDQVDEKEEEVAKKEIKICYPNEPSRLGYDAVSPTRQLLIASSQINMEMENEA